MFACLDRFNAQQIVRSTVLTKDSTPQEWEQFGNAVREFAQDEEEAQAIIQQAYSKAIVDPIVSGYAEPFSMDDDMSLESMIEELGLDG